MALSITSPYHVVCEGKADQVFFSRLFKLAGKNIQVTCPTKEDAGGLGKDAIFKQLQGLQAEFDRITHVVLLLDSDDDPAIAFALGCAQLAKAGKYVVPQTVGTMTAPGPAGSPSTAILTVPTNGSQGCLDTLLLPSFEQIYPNVLDCVDDFCGCDNMPPRGYTHASKLRLRALLAASYPRNPGVSLAYLLEEGHCPVDLNHASFGPLLRTVRDIFP